MTASAPRIAARALSLHRVTCYSILFAVYGFRDVSAWASVPSIYWMPVSLFRMLPGPPRSVLALTILQAAWKLSLLCSAVGFLTRWSTVTAATLGFFLLGLPNNFGKIHHLDAFPVLLLIIFAISQWTPRSRGLSDDADDEGWPIRLGRVMFLLVFAAAGISKLLHSGMEWATGPTMRYILLGNLFFYRPPTHLASWMAASPQLYRLAAISTIGIELAAVPAIFFRILRGPVVLALFGLQVGIALSMGLYFWPHLAGYALFIPWEKLLNVFSRKWSNRVVQGR